MTQHNSNAAASTRPGVSVCDDAIDGPEPTKSAQEKQAAITALRRDFIAEALRVVAVKASRAVDDLDLGDDIAVERGISIVINHVKAAVQNGFANTLA